MIKRIWKILTPILSAIIGVLVANTWNVFALFPFIPTNSVYEICLTAYFAIVDILLEFLWDWIVNIYEKLISSLNVVLSVPGTRNDITTDAVMTFNSQGIAEAIVSVEIKGRKKHFKRTDLVIKKPAIAEMQPASRRREVRIESDNYYINLEALFGNSDMLECKQEFKIAFIKDELDGGDMIKMHPELNKKKRNIKYKCNSMKLRMEDR